MITGLWYLSPSVHIPLTSCGRKTTLKTQLAVEPFHLFLKLCSRWHIQVLRTHNSHMLYGHVLQVQLITPTHIDLPQYYHFTCRQKLKLALRQVSQRKRICLKTMKNSSGRHSLLTVCQRSICITWLV